MGQVFLFYCGMGGLLGEMIAMLLAFVDPNYDFDSLLVPCMAAGAALGCLCYFISLIRYAGSGGKIAERLDSQIRGALQTALGAPDPARAAAHVKTAQDVLTSQGLDFEYPVWRANRNCGSENWCEGSPNPAELELLRLQCEELARDWTNPPTDDCMVKFTSLRDRIEKESKVYLRDWIHHNWSKRRKP